MIPTQYREAIPPQYRYALSAAAVSEALAGVPQYAATRLRFRREWWALEDRPSETKPYSALIARYSFFRASHPGGPEWTVEVCQVPREHVRQIRELLRADGLARLRQWFEGSAYLEGREGRHELRVLFDPLQRKLLTANH